MTAQNAFYIKFYPEIVSFLYLVVTVLPECFSTFTQLFNSENILRYIYRGYYMAARRYEFYLRVLKISHE